MAIAHFVDLINASPGSTIKMILLENQRGRHQIVFVITCIGGTGKRFPRRKSFSRSRLQLKPGFLRPAKILFVTGRSEDAITASVPP
jgi:hypothetical protein